MKKTTQIHMGGRHFFIDEDAFQKLNHYLESLKLHFAPDGDTGNEIVDDIEQRIAELLENKIIYGKQAVTLADVNETITVLGNVEDFIYTGTHGESHSPQDFNDRRDHRRFFRDPDNYYIGGVASGLGQYFNIDPLWIRLAFVILTLFNLVFIGLYLKGTGLLIYVILWIVVPKARTTAEKLQMRGKPVNLSTIKDSVNEEYEKVQTAIGPERSRSALEDLMRAFGLVMVAIFKFLIAAVGIIFMVVGSVFLAGLIMLVLGFTNVFGHFQFLDGIDFPGIASFFTNTSHYYIAVISLVILVLVPIAALIYGGIKILFDIKGRHPVLRAFLLVSWILALILFTTLTIMNVPNSAIEASGSDTSVIKTQKHPRLIIDVRDNMSNKTITRYSVLGYRFNYSKWDESLYDEAQLELTPSADEQFYLIVEKRIKNVDLQNTQHYLDRINYNWYSQDSVLYLDKYFDTDDDDFWMLANVQVELQIPENREVVITSRACDMLRYQQEYCNNAPAGKRWLMSPEGALVQVK